MRAVIFLIRKPAVMILGLVPVFIIGCAKEPAKAANKGEATGPNVTIADLTNTISGMQPASRLEKTNAVRSFNARGVIRDVPAGKGTLIVRHEDIPGLMPKMTMEFTVLDTNELRGLRVGDGIAFKVMATDEDSWIEGIRPIGTNEVTSTAPLDPSSASLLNIAQLKRGDPMPDAELLGETGLGIRLSDFNGRAVAFTFIFTRCPLPDFCPRMNQHFSRAREILLQQTNGPTNWQFLSISFDPEFDRPGVLTRYAYSYRGKNVERWTFAAAPENVMKAMASQLDFRFAKEGGTFLHNLRTVVLDPQRRVYRQFEGNKWKAEELAAALTEAAALTGKEPSGSVGGAD
jgi:protein SCO1/2